MTRTRALAQVKVRFRETGVPLRIATRPLVRGSRIRVDHGAMIMDIRTVHRPVPGETVVIWPGEASLEVRSTAPRLRQLVLHVEERDRTLWLRHRSLPRWDARHVQADSRDFLVGFDESHLFMAQLPGPVASVANAHHMLMPSPARALRAHGSRAVRQGEYFFLPVTPDERRAIEVQLAAGLVPRPDALGRASLNRKPHLASDSIGLAGSQFVRGTIRHPDHRPLRLRDWMKVALNTESRGFVGKHVTWVD